MENKEEKIIFETLDNGTRITNEIDKRWDILLPDAKKQLDKYGVIFLHYNNPEVDDDKAFETAEIYLPKSEGPIAIKSRFYQTAKEAGFVFSYEQFLKREGELEYYDGAITYEELGRAFLEKEICEIQNKKDNINILRHINFESIGREICANNNYMGCFSDYGYIRTKKKSHQTSKHKNHYIIDDDYVLTGIENAFNDRKSYWLSKKDYILAMYCFSENNCCSVEEELKNIDSYLIAFEKRLHIYGGAK